MLLLLGALVLLVGVSLGLSGIGGFLIAPLLIALAGLGPRQAVAEALISFVPSGLLGAFLYFGRHRFSLSLSLALSAGTLPGVLIGREISLSVNESFLQGLLAVAVVAAAMPLLLVQPQDSILMARNHAEVLPRNRVANPILVGAVGTVGGVLTVIAGVGGPLVAVPALLLLGIEVAEAVGASLLAAVVGASLGALALLPSVSMPLTSTFTTIVCLQIVGVATGVSLRSRISATKLRRLIAVSSVAAAVWLVWQTVH